ncbi:hypothetical protein EXIGLDRAFT_52212 [Exidia glandulosa HHB12029]|uniref:Uncharacterized protein n=1 Tax=Exidia glandulosa HHB12029 TaxID=1314781 RepID=A0A166MPR9_EXIGL|nr:hypothetical protein EXIGLDRAFT_52212 [Exidia glandulosa HHB12029]
MNKHMARPTTRTLCTCEPLQHASNGAWTSCIDAVRRPRARKAEVPDVLVKIVPVRVSSAHRVQSQTPTGAAPVAPVTDWKSHIRVVREHRGASKLVQPAYRVSTGSTRLEANPNVCTNLWMRSLSPPCVSSSCS